MPQYGDLENKVVLLTGGGNGIGAATVRAFAQQGAIVEFCDLDSTAGRRVEVANQGSRFTRLDITSERSLVAWIRAVAKRHKRIDALVNNAAIDPRIPLDEMTAAKLDKLVSVNLRPLFVTTREAVPKMKAGSIINVASITFHTGPANMSAYVATKGAVLGATRSLARELGPSGIRVNTVSPGWIMTDRQLRDYVNADVKKLIRRSQCVPDLLQPEEIAEVILFLASNASRAITGQEILADRGWAYS
ncbi:MAG TPA: SDR family NAD(P)-dependent oxidoreductase [Verrucomicrobiae bacterium]